MYTVICTVQGKVSSDKHADNHQPCNGNLYCPLSPLILAKSRDGIIHRLSEILITPSLYSSSAVCAFISNDVLSFYESLHWCLSFIPFNSKEIFLPYTWILVSNILGFQSRIVSRRLLSAPLEVLSRCQWILCSFILGMLDHLLSFPIPL